ncbi:MAG: ATP-binding protein [Thermodesulfobacteriota bacterium]
MAMCEFCTQHGEGKKWYENAANYSSELFHRVNSPQGLRDFLAGFRQSLARSVGRASALQRRFPWIYRLLIHPRVTRHLKKTHFGQVVPIEDVERLLPTLASIVRLPCVCRRVTTGGEQRYCFGIGLDLTDIYAQVPDFSGFERWNAEQALAFIRELDQRGMVHSLWTFNTPFIGALCNCDQDCLAYRSQHTLAIGRTMWKGECVAVMDSTRCTGCGQCRKRCLFDAIQLIDHQRRRYRIVPELCYGCGVCRPGCQHDAIGLVERSQVAGAVGDW